MVDQSIVGQHLESVGRATATANFALSKYWGKQTGGVQQPAVPSISVGIQGLTAEAEVRLNYGTNQEHEIRIAGNPANEKTCRRIETLLDAVFAHSGRKAQAIIRSDTRFPIAAGLASSAAGMAAVAGAAWIAAGLDPGDRSAIADCARLGSGSACRSVHDGYVAWEPTDDGSIIRQVASADHWPLELCLVRLDDRPKKVSSADGMLHCMETSPVWSSWVERAFLDAVEIEQAILDKDLEKLADLVEANCLLMHATTLTARPPIFYMQGRTLQVMETVTSLRRDGLPCFFTVDAGPNVKVFTAPGTAQTIKTALEDMAPIDVYAIGGGLTAEESSI
ncbi:MAG: diphosphomevalonate decarboxylase [Myxococcales bacterium]|nr:diphosphomevalonate decarboxylase [Myxococcales bacterium]